MILFPQYQPLSPRLPARKLSAPESIRFPESFRLWIAGRLPCCAPCLVLPTALVLLVALAGCSKLEHKHASETVYVLSKQTFLRDRVAAVSNRVAMVQNGQKLELLERGRRFLKVRTEKGEVGWIEEHAVVNPEVVTGFEQLQKGHQHDPVVATALLRDDGYLHLKPGRDTDRYYLLPEGDKLQLLVRASVPKAIGPQASGSASSYASKPSVASAKARAAARKAEGKTSQLKAASSAANPNPAVPKPPSAPAPTDSGAAEIPSPATLPNGQPVPMEDWWMVRDSEGKVGWVMSRRMDVDVPDEISGYAEGQRMVGAYLLRKVEDPESNFPDKLAPEYVTVLNPYIDGLPYDFSQVRVFTWNLRKHRYETAFRQRNLRGYLPVVVATQTLDKAGPVPTFEFKQGLGDSVTMDPETGATRPSSTETLTYRLDGSLVHRVEPAPPPSAIPAPAHLEATPAAGAKNRRKPFRAKHHHKK